MALAPTPPHPDRAVPGVAPPVQRSFDDLGAPLAEVTFAIVDLETTGGSPATEAITEVGAVKVRGGEVLGTFQTMVNPGRAIPPAITVLTGITQAMVVQAPRIEVVLPSLLEFVGDAVIVGHNVRFDVGFLDAALLRHDRPRLANARVDTVRLARRLLADEVRDHRLGTLARSLRLPHQPTHRALDDALATADLLHLLLERAGRLGVTGLDDLLALPTLAAHPQAAKLRLTEALPRAPGVYLFRDRAGRVLYVGKATDLRSRVRSYFSGDERRKVAQLLREVHRIDHRACPAPLEADVLELRLIHRHEPRFNRQGTRTSAASYVKLTRDERFPRLSVVRQVKADRGLYLGPLPSRRQATLVVEAIESAVPLRRCTRWPPKVPVAAPCAAAQLGVATCPCAGAIAPGDYDRLVQQVVRGLTAEPLALLAPLDDRMHELAAAERYEEAADVRDRAAALAGALRRKRRFDALRAAGELRLALVGVGGARLERGRVVEAWCAEHAGGAAGGDADGPTQPALGSASGAGALDPPVGPSAPAPPPTLFETAALPPPAPHEAEELLCVARWLDRHRGRVRVEHAEVGLASPLPHLPAFTPAGGRPRRPRHR